METILGNIRKQIFDECIKSGIILSENNMSCLEELILNKYKAIYKYTIENDEAFEDEYYRFTEEECDDFRIIMYKWTKGKERLALLNNFLDTKLELFSSSITPQLNDNQTIPNEHIAKIILANAISDTLSEQN